MVFAAKQVRSSTFSGESMANHRRSGSNSFVAIGMGAAAVAVLLLVAGVALAVRAVAAHKARPVLKTSAAGEANTLTKKASAVTAGQIQAPAPLKPVSNPATDQVVPVLMYHHIMPKPNNFIAISPGTFDQQMKWLHDNGYHAISIAQMTAFVQAGQRLPEKPVLITFDDGRSNQLTYGVPILKKYGFTATFFVVKKWVDSPSKSFLHADDLVKMAGMGYDIESHTNSHTFLIRSKSEDYAAMKKRLWGETNGMLNWLQRTVRTAVTALAYPGGAEDHLSPVLSKDAGYALAFTTNDGLVRYKGQDPRMLPRYNAGARGLRFSSFIAIFQHAGRVSTPSAYAKTAGKK
jgi:peptidoglycan/xylan/chitin deacetylase (PgdA/CDA1 family)